MSALDELRSEYQEYEVETKKREEEFARKIGDHQARIEQLEAELKAVEAKGYERGLEDAAKVADRFFNNPYLSRNSKVTSDLISRGIYTLISKPKPDAGEKEPTHDA